MSPWNVWVVFRDLELMVRLSHAGHARTITATVLSVLKHCACDAGMGFTLTLGQEVYAKVAYQRFQGAWAAATSQHVSAASQVTTQQDWQEWTPVHHAPEGAKNAYPPPTVQTVWQPFSRARHWCASLARTTVLNAAVMLGACRVWWGITSIWLSVKLARRYCRIAQYAVVRVCVLRACLERIWMMRTISVSFVRWPIAWLAARRDALHVRWGII